MDEFVEKRPSRLGVERTGAPCVSMHRQESWPPSFDARALATNVKGIALLQELLATVANLAELPVVFGRDGTSDRAYGYRGQDLHTYRPVGDGLSHVDDMKRRRVP